MERRGGPGAVLSDIRTVAETGSTNADVLALAREGAGEGLWLRAGRQSAGRGRLGRPWVSPVGNLYASTLVRLRRSDPPAATLALVAGVAVEEAVGVFLARHPRPDPGSMVPISHVGEPRAAPRAARWTPAQGRGDGVCGASDGLLLKWPNDLLLEGAKVAGILLERAEDAVVVGVGVNLAHHPDLPDRRTTSLAEHGATVLPETLLDTLVESFTRWLARWRGEGLAPVRARWVERAHPVGTALTVRLPDASAVDGLFDGLNGDGALMLRLAGGERRAIHAGDVFLL